MINELQIDGFRGISSLTIAPLGRVNLLVGMNTAGKTTALEAIELVSNVGDPLRLRSICYRRGEILGGSSNGASGTILDPRHLFYGHQCNSTIQITVQHDSSSAEFTASFESALDGDPGNLKLRWLPEDIAKKIDLLASKGSSLVSMFSGTHPWDVQKEKRCLFVPSSGLSPMQAMHELDSVLMTSNEAIVLTALQSIEPNIERLALSLDTVSVEGRFGGVIVNCKNRPPRLPIGTFGEGIWRMLGIALSLTWCKDGILLIDDIDSGLHYTVMEKMWNLIFETAKSLDVQVFATTHSRDCIESLASIARSDVYDNSDVMIHRIEAGKSHAVSYSEGAVNAVAEFGNEVR